MSIYYIHTAHSNVLNGLGATVANFSARHFCVVWYTCVPKTKTKKKYEGIVTADIKYKSVIKECTTVVICKLEKPILDAIRLLDLPTLCQSSLQRKPPSCVCVCVTQKEPPIYKTK